ncbi:MAG: hypothetical protein ACI8ZB_003630 [Desulforhopalus sp.]
MPLKIIRVTLFAFLFCLLATDLSLGAQEHIGRVKDLVGIVIIIRQNHELSPERGTRLKVLDTIQTGQDSSVSLIMQDNTVFSLGPNTKLALKEFQFNPQKKKLSLISRIFKGSLIYTSGAMSKLSPKAVKIETPDGSVAVRGTRFAISIVDHKL